MNNAMLQTHNLAVGYDKKVLIQGIEIAVCPGEILTLIGPNGAGKSTIIKSITKQLEILGGTVCVAGKSLSQTGSRELAQKVSVMMTGRLEPELMSCEEVVEAGRFPYTGRFGVLSDADREKVREAMELVHIRELADKSFTCISDGQRQRVMLARAICQEPEILILDEPTSFLDIRHKLELLAILKRLVLEKQIAVIISMHELDLAQKLSDRVVCVRGDRIDKCGTPDEIFTDAYIEQLYQVSCGSYHTVYGFMELEKPAGKPEVFVIGGGGSGIPIYRQLQRKGIPFAAGVLHENDMDLPAAQALAAQIITERAFEPIGEQALAQAKTCMETCTRVICCPERFGTMNAGNQQLMQLAQKQGKLFNHKRGL